MKLTEKAVKNALDKAENKINICWDILIDIKEFRTKKTNLGANIVEFQEKLAETIFDLHLIRDQIISEEKRIIINRSNYNRNWFLSKVRLLSKFKEGIDFIVNTIKALGDAFVYFFYQNDIDLLSKHYNHQRVINNTADIGIRGELEFIRNVKHVDGKFTLYHGITNCLRYGDFSFVDLEKFRVEWIGELKTKKTDDKSIELQLTILERNSYRKTDNFSKKDTVIYEKDKRKRQVLEIAKFLTKEESLPEDNMDLVNATYINELNDLFAQTKINKTTYKKISSGLLICCTRISKKSFAKKIFERTDREKNPIKDASEGILKEVSGIIKESSNNNGIIIGSLLYDKDFNEKNSPGLPPIFWYPLDKKLLKGLYLHSCFIINMFNPAFIFDEIYGLGYKIESNYLKNSVMTYGPFLREISSFDIFISNILNHLFTENYAVDIMTSIIKSELWKKNSKISLRHKLHFDF